MRRGKLTGGQKRAHTQGTIRAFRDMWIFNVPSLSELAYAVPRILS